MGTVLQTAMTQRKLTGNVSLDDKRSSLQSVHLFGTNVETDVRLTFQTPRNLRLETVADYRSIPIGIHYFAPRPAADADAAAAGRRAGGLLHLGDEGLLPRHRGPLLRPLYVNRWRLEKRNPGPGLSEPVQPIVYYIDRTIRSWR